MKFITILFGLFLSSLIFSSQAFAHEDHALGDGAFHSFYHLVLWGLFAMIIYRGYRNFKNRHSQLEQ